MFTPSLQDIVRNMREAEQAKMVPETPIVPTGVLRPVEYLEVTADLMLPVLKALVQGQPLSPQPQALNPNPSYSATLQCAMQPQRLRWISAQPRCSA